MSPRVCELKHFATRVVDTRVIGMQVILMLALFKILMRHYNVARQNTYRIAILYQDAR